MEWVIFAVLAGIFTTMEAFINGRLGQAVTPKIATLHSLVTGVFVILVINIVKGTLNQYRKVIHVSPQWLIGGIFGTLIIFLVTKTIPELGVSKTLTIVVASQIISGLIIDTWVLGYHQLHWYKISGVMLLMIGTYFITR